MSLTDKFCSSSDLREDEKLQCYKLTSDFLDLLNDLKLKGCLRANLESRNNEKLILNVILNVRKTTISFNKLFDIYAEKVKVNSKQKLKSLKKLGDFTEEEVSYLLFSEMIFIFLQCIEEFRAILLFILKLPVSKTINGKKYKIGKKSTLNPLLTTLQKMGIKNADEVNKLIDYKLRNGLSHSLFWVDEKGDKDCSEPHLHYSENIEFTKIHCVSLKDLYVKMRNQSMYTNCLLNVIGDWFW